MLNQFDQQIFIIAVNSSADQLSSLLNFAEDNNSLFKLNSVNDFIGEKLTFLTKLLCEKFKTVANTRTTKLFKQHYTTKRDVTHLT